MLGRELLAAVALGALYSELLRELVALPSGALRGPERRPPAARPGHAGDDEPDTHEKYRDRDRARDHEPAGVDREGSAQHVDIDTRRILREHVDRESGGCGDEQQSDQHHAVDLPFSAPGITPDPPRASFTPPTASTARLRRNTRRGRVRHCPRTAASRGSSGRDRPRGARSGVPL